MTEIALICTGFQPLFFCLTHQMAMEPPIKRLYSPHFSLLSPCALPKNRRRKGGRDRSAAAEPLENETQTLHFRRSFNAARLKAHRPSGGSFPAAARRGGRQRRRRVGIAAAPQRHIAPKRSLVTVGRRRTAFAGRSPKLLFELPAAGQKPKSELPQYISKAEGCTSTRWDLRSSISPEKGHSKKEHTSVGRFPCALHGETGCSFQMLPFWAAGSTAFTSCVFTAPRGKAVGRCCPKGKDACPADGPSFFPRHQKAPYSAHSLSKCSNSTLRFKRLKSPVFLTVPADTRTQTGIGNFRSRFPLLFWFLKTDGFGAFRRTKSNRDFSHYLSRG